MSAYHTYTNPMNDINKILSEQFENLTLQNAALLNMTNDMINKIEQLSIKTDDMMKRIEQLSSKVNDIETKVVVSSRDI